MQDNKIDDLLSQYSDNLGHFIGDIPQRAKRPMNFWKPLFATSIGVALVTSFVLTPRNAEAASIDKVMNGLNSVKYWHSVAWDLDPKTNQWVTNYAETFLDGLLMTESRAGQRDQTISLIEPGFLSRYIDRMPYILKVRLGKDKRIDLHYDPATHPWQYYKNVKLVRKDGLTYLGVPAYSLSVSGKKNGTVFEAIVDKSTNLPLRTQMQVGNAPKKFNYRIDYSYNKPENLATLRPKSDKPTISAEQEVDQLIKTWSSMTPNSMGRTIFSSTISPDGTIWIASKLQGNDSERVALKNKDYCPQSSYILSDFTGDVSYQKAFAGIVVNKFVPIYENNPLPKSVQVNFFGSGGKSSEVTSCELESEVWNFPRYFPPIMYDVNTDILKSSYLRSRGRERQMRGDYRRAIEAYIECYRVEKEMGMIINTSQSTLKFAAECYEKLGNKTKAQELRGMIPKGDRGKY